MQNWDEGRPRLHPIDPGVSSTRPMQTQSRCINSLWKRQKKQAPPVLITELKQYWAPTCRQVPPLHFSRVNFHYLRGWEASKVLFLFFFFRFCRLICSCPVPFDTQLTPYLITLLTGWDYKYILIFVFFCFNTPSLPFHMCAPLPKKWRKGTDWWKSSQILALKRQRLQTLFCRTEWGGGTFRRGKQLERFFSISSRDFADATWDQYSRFTAWTLDSRCCIPAVNSIWEGFSFFVFSFHRFARFPRIFCGWRSFHEEMGANKSQKRTPQAPFPPPFAPPPPGLLSVLFIWLLSALRRVDLFALFLSLRDAIHCWPSVWHESIDIFVYVLYNITVNDW